MIPTFPSAAIVCLLFLLSRLLSSVFSFPFSDAVSVILSALLPAAFFFFSTKRGLPAASLSLSPRNSLGQCLFSFPFFLLIYGLSSLCSLIGSRFGFDSTVVYTAPLWQEVAVSAVLAAAAEEFVFRYVLLRILSVRDRLGAVLVSSVLFALMHTNSVQIPYALCAGFLLGTVTLACGSVFPAFVMHLTNNLFSLLIAYYRMPAAVASLSVCAVGSVFCAAWFCRHQKEREAVRRVLTKTPESGKTVLSLVSSWLVLVAAALLFLTFYR